MAKKSFNLPANSDDFPGDSQERKDASLAAAGALCNEEHIISDWGDFEGDYSERELHEAHGMGSVDAFYDSHYPAEELRIRKRKDESDD